MCSAQILTRQMTPLDYCYAFVYSAAAAANNACAYQLNFADFFSIYIMKNVINLNLFKLISTWKLE